MKPRVAILVPFDSWDPAYSLASVVENQLKALVKYGYEPVIATLGRFKGDIPVKGVEHRQLLPAFEYTDYSQTREVHEDFEKQVTMVQDAIEKLTDVTHIITHDLIFQGWFLVHNVALRRAKLDVKWLHWIHSAPSPREKEPYPFDHFQFIKQNETLVYLNEIDKIRAAEQYGVFPSDVAVVPNAVDVRTFGGVHPFTEALIDNHGLLDADIISVYPVSTPRMISGKQIHKAVKVHAKLKQLYGLKTKFIIPNAHANAQKEKDLVKEWQEKFLNWGLSPSDVIFTSTQQAPTYELGVPRDAIGDLFKLSNLFIFPSISENCSLVLLEAALNGNVIVLNKSFLPMRAQLGDNALYFEFGALGSDVEYQNEEAYYEDIAKIVFAELKKNTALTAQTKVRKEFNYSAMFRNHLEPLLYA